MDIILLEKINNLGELGQQVKVKPGYGRNYLIPNGKAVTATPDNVKKFEARRAELEKAQADVLGSAKARAEALAQLSITITRRAGDEGKLYGSVGTSDIAEAVITAGEALAKNEVRLPDGPYRTTGEFDVAIHLHADVDTSVKLFIVPEASTDNT